MEVCIEDGQEFTVFVKYLICIHILMVYRDIAVFLESNTIQAGSQTEYPFFYLAQFKIGTEHFIIYLEFLVFQFMGIIRPVPRHHCEVTAFQLACQSLYLCIFLLGGGSVSIQ